MKTLTGVFGTLAMLYFGLLIMTLTGCGLMTSQGHFEMAGDQQGIHAASDMLNGLARVSSRHDEYFRTRRLQETEETYRDIQPGFWSKVFFGGLAAKPIAEDSGS